jgi:hypothetical protein
MKSSECNGIGQPAGCRTLDGRVVSTLKGVAMIDPHGHYATTCAAGHHRRVRVNGR